MIVSTEGVRSTMPAAHPEEFRRRAVELARLREKPIAAIATTSQSAHKLHPLCQSLGITLHLAEQLTECDGVTRYSGSLKDHLARLWPHHRAFIFGLATGAVVRLIYPLLTDKATDPAVLVIDPQGRFVISRGS